MTILHGWINGIDDVNEAKKKINYYIQNQQFNSICLV